MNDETKAAYSEDLETLTVEWFRWSARSGGGWRHQDAARVFDRLLAHRKELRNVIDGEPARLAAALENLREACARNMVDAHAHRGPLWPSQLADSIRATPLDATPLADELRTLRALVADMDAIDEALRKENATWRARAQALQEGLVADGEASLELASENETLRARVAELEAMLGARHRLAATERERAGDVVEALESRAEKAEAQVAAARAVLVPVVERSSASLSATAYVSAADILRAMDEAALKEH